MSRPLLKTLSSFGADTAIAGTSTAGVGPAGIGAAFTGGEVWVGADRLVGTAGTTVVDPACIARDVLLTPFIVRDGHLTQATVRGAHPTQVTVRAVAPERVGQAADVRVVAEAAADVPVDKSFHLKLFERAYGRAFQCPMVSLFRRQLWRRTITSPCSRSSSYALPEISRTVILFTHAVQDLPYYLFELN
jgi:hypothetical protein